ncbi:hypothetical protein ACERK3_01000 [Phycisphaerales bacterium AB-hyl4]|uniref:DUF4175 family protein n=1 Tax=Natronomicrosphaera hydrolytica TaxID=3242702 RepID=A0ABV4U325_9BACT
MEAVARQLVWVRRWGRGLLVVQRLAQFVAGALVVMMALGGLDFLLRLPTWGRVFIVLVAVAAGGTWLWTQLGRALRFRPSLSDLALRAERLFPVLRGSLASAVEFSLRPEAYASPSTTAVLSGASVSHVREQLERIELKRLIDPTRTWRVLAVLLVVLLAFGGVLLASPGGAATAAERWLTPWTGAEWPRRVEVVNLTEDRVWPTDAPLRLRAEVERGHSAGMRVWVEYRLFEPTPDGERRGPRESLLMSEQAGANADGDGGARYERLIDLPEHLLGAGDADYRGTVEYRLIAGDHRTEPRRIELVSRPAVTGVTAQIEPPAYAEGLVAEQTIHLHRQSGQVATATARAGSRVTLAVEMNKPVVMSGDTEAALATVLPGLPTSAEVEVVGGGDAGSDGADAMRSSAGADGEAVQARALLVSFVLRETVETPIQLVDRHGLESRSERRYRLEAVADQPPSVSMVEPVSDQAVLPRALVDVEAMAQDDVAVEQLTLEAELPVRDSADDEGEVGTRELASESGRQPQLALRHALDLAEMHLRPGDAVVLSAVAVDVYDFEGDRHEPVRSSERRLRIIDEPEFIGQLRGELSAVRQQAQRIDERQRRLTEEDPEPSEARTQQQRLTERVEGQASLVDRLEQRMERNRLEEPALSEMMSRAGELLEDARAASEAAEQQFEQAAGAEDADEAAAGREQARERQGEVREALAELGELLDQSRDALTLQLRLRQLLTEQETLEADTRRLLPQTVGEDVANLPEELQQALRELAEQQRETGQQADELVRQMRSTATALNREDASDRDRVSGELLDEAATMAERGGLGEQMEQAGEAIDDNQLSQAGQGQHDSMELMEQMLSEMGRGQERMQAMLQRRLDELARAITRLIEQQRSQNQRAEDAERLPDLEQGQAGVRRNTMSVSDQAGRSQETEAVATVLDQAVASQGEAIVSMRADQRPATQVAQREALEHLEAALERVREQQREAQQEQARQQRAQLREAYERLAETQKDLREQTEAAAEAGARDRRQRARLIELGHEQSDLRIEAERLGEQAGQVMMFELIHGRIDRSLSGVVRDLRRASADAALQWEQSEVERMLRMLAAVLEDDEQDADFAGEMAGGDGGGGGETPIVPPAAELKMLREMQQVVYDRTREASDQGQARGPDAVADRLRDLSSEQRELSAVGERLIEQMRQMQQMREQGGMPGPGGPGGPDGGDGAEQ